jgi:phosphoenolpyruvate synthase/pyruvate phosphate dikinase
LDLIDRAIERCQSTSFADLGGVWAVDAGYAFYAARQPGVTRVVVVDDNFTPAVTDRASRLDSAEIVLVEANLGSDAAARSVGEVDAVILFDVLLHQVNPNWDEILSLYGQQTKAFLIVNPQWTHSDCTVRLLDLGKDEYLASVPVQEIHHELFAGLDEMNPKRSRLWRDVHDVWQWGIVDVDLTAKLADLGFRLIFFNDAGPWRGLPRFANRAFLYVRD